MGLVLALGALLTAVPAAAVAWTAWRVTRRPYDHPGAYLRRRTRPASALLCLGDSITHGHIGADWVGSVRTACLPHGIGVVNAGVNGDLAWNLLHRLPAALAVQPRAAVLLVGTNDAMGAHLESRGQDYATKKKLPELPTLANYEANLRAVLERLTSDVERVAVCTLPPLGEDPDADPSHAHDAVVRRLADEFGATLLDVRATLAELHPAPGRPYVGEIEVVGRRMIGAIVRHYLGGRSWDRIADSTGQAAFVDTIHLADRAAARVAALVQGFVLATSETTDPAGCSGSPGRSPRTR